MKKLIERFALYLLRKIGRTTLEFAVGKEVLFMGCWWLVTGWSMTHDDMSCRRTLNVKAICNDEEVLK